MGISKATLEEMLKNALENLARLQGSIDTLRYLIDLCDDEQQKEGENG